MKCFNYFPQKESRSGFLFPFVGGLIIGGLVTPLFFKNNQQPNYPYYPYYPNYTMGNYSYPYNNGFYHY